MCVFFVVCFIPFLPRVKRKIFLSSRRFVLSLSCLSKKKKKREKKRERGEKKNSIIALLFEWWFFVWYDQYKYPSEKRDV